MEDILASIRRILSEDDPGAAPPPPPAPQAAATPEPVPLDDDVLELDESMLVRPTTAAPMTPPAPAAEPAPIPAKIVTPEAQPPAMRVADPEPEPEAYPIMEQAATAMEPAHSPADPSPNMGLVAPEAAAATASIVGNLMRTLAAERSTQVSRNGPTIEDLVREELRPLLKQWLDNYLPPLVERLVRAEIERVVGRAVL